MPGGVSSPVRAFRAVGGSPLFIERGEGPYLVDVDGNRYLDYVLSWGPLILGHAHPRVVGALEEALRKGTSFGAPSPLELELARLIQQAMPSLELVRFVSSGTEATMSALRVARAFTGRSKIVKFVGCYHGHADLLLVRAGSGVATLGLPDSPGVHGGRGRRHAHRAVQRPRGGRDALRRARRHRSGDRRAGRREHGPRPSRAGLSPGAAQGHRRARRPARLRRGDDRVPRASGRSAGALRRHARPDDTRQGHRRRPSGGGVRRSPRDHGARGSGRRRVPGGDAVGEPARDDRGDRDACGRSPSTASGKGWSAPARGSRRVSRRSADGSRSCAQERCSACSSRTCPSRAGTRPSGPIPTASPRITARCSSAGSISLRLSSKPASSRRFTAMQRSTRRSLQLRTRSQVSEPRVYPSLP